MTLQLKDGGVLFANFSSCPLYCDLWSCVNFHKILFFLLFCVRGLHCQTDVGSTHGNCLSLIYEKAFLLLLNIATLETLYSVL